MTSTTLSIKEAADVLKVHPKTVEDLVKSCALPAARVGRRYVIMTRDVMAYIEGQIVSQTAARMRTARPTSRQVITKASPTLNCL